MSRVETKNSTSSLLYTVMVLGLVAVAFCYALTANRQVEAGTAKSDKSSAASVAPAATFAADSATLGTFPDGTGTPTCGNVGSGNRDVTFTVTGLTGTVTAVSVDFNGRHTWVNDMDVSLRAPGGSPNLLLFGRTGSTSTNDCGNTIGSNDLASTNTYTFADSASANWWTTAAAGVIPTSSSRTVVTGGPGVTTPATTSLNTTFGGMTAAAANGTWTLRFTDRGVGDTGAVTAANLTITAGAVVNAQHVVDFDGDGKTDYSIVRNTGGGPSGAITWFNQPAAGGAFTATVWGSATDFFVPEDYDGDGKTDVAIWRPGAPFNAFYYILQSQTNTMRAEAFGQTGDDPTIVGDYDGDNKADVSVYRSGANAGDQSFWYWRTVLNGPVFARQWGQNGDFLNPGDFDGDGKNDFSVQRNAGGGQAAFHTLKTNGNVYTVTVFGTPTDVVVPGDYDGDGKTDIATIRGLSGQINWFVLPSSGGAYTVTPWGNSATDFGVQGDYDGDGKTDMAVWRPNADPTQDFFYIKKSSDGNLLAAEWGQNGDYPVANFNSH